MVEEIYLSSLINPSPDDEREIGTFVDEEGDIDNESDVEFDRNDQQDRSTMMTILSQIYSLIQRIDLELAL